MGSNPIGALEMSPILIRSQNLVNCSMKVISFMTVTLLDVLRSSFEVSNELDEAFRRYSDCSNECFLSVIIAEPSAKLTDNCEE